jgi:octaprenyl-diphosphate synthase
MQAIEPAHPAIADVEDIRQLVSKDMEAVNRLIERCLDSDVVLVKQIARYIVNSGGKRLRPLVVLLSARAFAYQGEANVDLAAIIEFIHTATLLHDDVVDESGLRRGRETANAVWGNAASVLVGDFLYSRAFQMMVDVGSMRIMEILADTTNVIAEGEVMQLVTCQDPDTTEERYLCVIRAKTAKLFEAAAKVGAVLSMSTPEQENAMAQFGHHLGTAYQLIDDVLDYRGSPAEIGKNVGDDLAEGKPTLPLIHAIRTGSKAQARFLRDAIREGAPDDLQGIISAVESTDAIAYTARAARAEASLALDALEAVPRSDFREGLAALTEFTISRTY